MAAKVDITSPTSTPITNIIPVKSRFSKGIEIIRLVAAKVFLTLFNVWMLWSNSLTWGTGFVIGIIFRKEVKSRVTDLFSNMMYSSLAYKMALPTACFSYWFNLTKMFSIAPFVAGLDIGSRWGLYAEETLKTWGYPQVSTP